MSKKFENKTLIEMLKISELRNASKTLLANIRFASIDDPIKTIAIVSPNPDEGKTTVAVNLAASAASSGKTCLVVDCDMRKRRLNKILEVYPKNGLLSVLAGECKLADAITATSVTNLFFLDCEPNIPSPPDTLSTKRFASLVSSLHEAFDYVIFDTSPILTFVDAAIVANLVDATILCVKQYKTKRNDVEDSKKQLLVAQAKLLGSVMTFADEADSDYYYAYYDKSGKRVDKANKNDYALSNEDVSGKSFNELENTSVANSSNSAIETGFINTNNVNENFSERKKKQTRKKRRKKQ